MVSTILRIGQARLTCALVACSGLTACLTAWHDPFRLVAGGLFGLVGLSLALSRESSSRLLFGGLSLLLFGAYLWTGGETVEVEISYGEGQVRALVGDLLTTADLPPLAPGRTAIAIDAGGQPPSMESPGRLDELGLEVARALTTNVPSGVVDLTVTDRAGARQIGPVDLWQPVEGGAPPLQQEAGSLPSRGSFLLLGEAAQDEAEVRFGLRAGGPPVTLLLQLDGADSGLAVRLWPARQELTVHLVRGGAIGEPIQSGFQRFRRPPLAGAQLLLRELLRAWLIGLTLVAYGVLLVPLSRLLLGPADWLAPTWAGPLVAAALAGAGLALTGWIASEVLERIPHVQDSVAYLFQARTLALGRLSAPLPPVPPAFEQEFILMRDGQWFGKYPPGFPALLTLGVLAGAPWLASPVAAGLTLGLLYLTGRALYGGPTALLAMPLLLSSPFFIFMSGSMMSHPVGLALSMAGLLLVIATVRTHQTWVPLLAGVVLGWLFATRQLTGLAVLGPAVVWLAVRRLQARRSLGVLLPLGLGWTWPALGLLAYNRALTGNPFLNPYELWWDFDRIGFGPTIGMHGGHDLERGFFNTYVNLSGLQTELFGWPTYLTLSFALLPFALGRVRPGDWLCAGVTLCLIGAYVFHWADGYMYGPRYFYEAAGCLALLTARGVVAAAEAASGVARTVVRKRAALPAGPFYSVLLTVLVGGSVLAELPRQIEAHRGYNFVSGARQALVQQAGLHRALVLVPTSQPFAWWDYGSVFSANDPLLQNDVIYARDLGPEQNRETAAAFPDRTTYLLVGGSLRPLAGPGR